MTQATRNLLEQLESHANKFRLDTPCLLLIPATPHQEGQPIKVYASELRDAVKELLETDKAARIAFI